jgi:DNA-binding MarR family transcriptional regulator
VDVPALTEDNVEERADELGGLNDILGLRIRLAHGAVYRHFTETFAELDLTQKQVSTLWLVHDRPGISQIDLGGRLRMDRATTMTIVNRLQDRAYLRRERSTSDGRKQALYVTDAGRDALAEAKRCIGEHEAWLKGRFSAEEIEKLVEMLARIHE